MGNAIDPKEATTIRSRILGQMLGFPAGAIGYLHTLAQPPSPLSLTGVFAIGLMIKCSADFAVYSLSNDRQKPLSDKGIVQGVIVGGVMGAAMIGAVALIDPFSRSANSSINEDVSGEQAINTLTTSTEPSVCMMPLDAPKPSCGK